MTNFVHEIIHVCLKTFELLALTASLLATKNSIFCVIQKLGLPNFWLRRTGRKNQKWLPFLDIFPILP